MFFRRDVQRLLCPPLVMPPNLRIPVAEFQSPLLAPIRIPLRAYVAAVRPQCALRGALAARVAQCGTPCRSLHLYKTARARTLLGQHKIRLFNKYDIRPPSKSQHLVNLVKSAKDPTPLATNISLQQLYDDYVKPGKMLYLTNPTSKAREDNFRRLQEENVPQQSRDYALCEPYDIIKKGSKIIKLQPQHGKQLGGLKNIMIRLSSPTQYFKVSLDRAWQFIDAGSPVEFRIRIRGSTSKKEKMEREDFKKWRWMHDHWPHLRPDFILKAMPEGSVFLIDPVSDGYIVQFVISRKVGIMPKLDLNHRLWKIKEGVRRSIETGKQSQLPQPLRQKLRDSGITAYSPHSGLPRDQALAGYTIDKSVANWGFEEGEEPLELTAKARRKVRAIMAARTKEIPKGGAWAPSGFVADYQRALDIANQGKLDSGETDGVPIRKHPVHDSWELTDALSGTETAAEEPGSLPGIETAAGESGSQSIPIRKCMSRVEQLTDALSGTETAAEESGSQSMPIRKYISGIERLTDALPGIETAAGEKDEGTGKSLKKGEGKGKSLKKKKAPWSGRGRLNPKRKEL